MKRVAIYCRLSDEDTDKKHVTDESESIQNQKSMLLSFAMEKGWSVYKIYCDEDYSGADKNRPEFNQMLCDCESGKIDIVLCKTQSRFSRDMELVEKYIHGKFLEWNIRFIGLIDNADTEIEGNKKARQINGLINEWYLEDLSVNIKRTLRHKKEKGEYTGAFAPYGYFRNPDDKHQLVIDPVASEVVKTIFNLYKSGLGYIKIAKYLNEKGIPNPYTYKKQIGMNINLGTGMEFSEKWNPDTIRHMLKNEVYIGNMVQGKRKNISYKSNKALSVPKKNWIIVQNTHEPIIDVETWNFLQERFAGIDRPQKNSGEVQMFSQKVFCAECRSVLRKKTTRNKYGQVFDYLVCKARTKGDLSCGNSKAIAYNELEGIVMTEINSLLRQYYNEEVIATEFERRSKSEDGTPDTLSILEKERRDITSAVRQKEQYFKTLYEDKLKGLISDEQFLTLSRSFQDEISRFEKRIESIDKEIERCQAKQSKKNNKHDILKKYQHIERLDKIILDEFIESIDVGVLDANTKNREILIKWAI